ncbi:MAG: pimeloyl-ACP methyl ester carboxylesterase [Crocinitomicaceae bacterium]|jgi:pimeloyl-ACP methyl ester carboxylesterase
MNSGISIKNEVYQGAMNKSSLFDLETPADWNGKLIVFIHGYMGYKDWGCWNLVQSYFVENNYGFLKYNVSHNGGTLDNPIDFEDLNSFANNSYSKEVLDFEAILEMIQAKFDTIPETHLIGHSRGGGIALLQSENKLVSKICSWAGISSIASRFPKGELLEQWKTEGIRYYQNGRTKQAMPHLFDQYLDYVSNKDRLDIKSYCKSSKKKTLVIHGDNDASIKIVEGESLANWLGVELTVVKNTQHTFDASQPWKITSMPNALKEACELTLKFLNT